MGQTQLQQISRLVATSDQEQDIKLFTRMMLQSVIPRKKTEKREIIVENGHWKIGIQAGIGDHLPSGSLPRMILIWTIAEAIQKQDRIIHLGDSLSGFMSSLGIDNKTGGRWGSITRTKTAARQLFKSRVAIEYTGPKGYGYDGIQFASRIRAFWSKADPDQTDLEGHTIELDERFYNSIVDQPFPLDMNTLKAIAKSPLGIDLYVFLAYRIFNVNKKGEPAYISWEQLHEQLGSPFSCVDNFARNARRELKKLQLAWPSLNYKTPRGRLVIYPSPLSVEHRPAQRQLKG